MFYFFEQKFREDNEKKFTFQDMIRLRAISPQHIVEITRTPPGLQRLRHHPLCHTTSLRVGSEDPARLSLALLHLLVAPLLWDCRATAIMQIARVRQYAGSYSMHLVTYE